MNQGRIETEDGFEADIQCLKDQKQLYNNWIDAEIEKWERIMEFTEFK